MSMWRQRAGMASHATRRAFRMRSAKWCVRPDCSACKYISAVLEEDERTRDAPASRRAVRDSASSRAGRP